jgi:HAMP domain-containing protein
LKVEVKDLSELAALAPVLLPVLGLTLYFVAVRMMDATGFALLMLAVSLLMLSVSMLKPREESLTPLQRLVLDAVDAGDLEVTLEGETTVEVDGAKYKVKQRKRRTPYQGFVKQGKPIQPRESG